MSDAFDRAYSGDSPLFGTNPSEELMEYVQLIPPPAAALDFGCGDGRDTLALLRAGYEVTAVDRSTTAIAKLTRFAKEQRLAARLHAVACDVKTFNAGVDCFDIVTSATLLDHLKRDEGRDVADRMVRALRVGGILFAEVHTVDDAAVRGNAPVSEFAREILHYFGPNELLTLFGDAVRILYYRDQLEWDYDHGEPHQHGFAILVGRKIM